MLLLTEGQMSDHNGAFLLLSALPRAKELLGWPSPIKPSLQPETRLGCDTQSDKHACSNQPDWRLVEQQIKHWQ